MDEEIEQSRKRRWDDHLWHEVPHPGNWADKAACKGYPTWWWFAHANDTKERRRAKEICMSCEVRAECATFAEPHYWLHGMWGGVDKTTRRREQRVRRAADREAGAITFRGAVALGVLATLTILLIQLWMREPFLVFLVGITTACVSFVWYGLIVGPANEENEHLRAQLDEAIDESLLYWQCLPKDHRQQLTNARRQPRVRR
jgi:WhiB family transcriptional regulator, redox-sensing transcriptional regulator